MADTKRLGVVPTSKYIFMIPRELTQSMGAATVPMS